MHDKTIGWEEQLSDFWKLFWLKADNGQRFNLFDDLKSLISSLLATQNAEHQLLVLEENKVAKQMEQVRIIGLLEGMKANAKVIRSGGLFNGDTPVILESDQSGLRYVHITLDEAITKIRQS